MGNCMFMRKGLVHTYKQVNIYGAEWDGTASTVWARTDDAASFANPSPAVNNGSGSSPFDNLMPWSGMVKETQDGNVLVAIPKFWYKWTKSGKKLKLQIADAPKEGFLTSPAHADRGDSKGERDMVYIGRYHCNGNWKSAGGSQPKNNITRISARSGIHGLGAAYWQMDYAIRMTVQMLYLVEFADWDSQKVIGFGCSPGGNIFNMGMTDGMKYYTGTSAANRTTYGCCQYRYIEGLWDNVYDWMDGCYYDGNGLNIIKNPNSFHNSSNGVAVGMPTSGYPSAMNVPTVSGLEWAIYPSASGGSDTTYVTDTLTFTAANVCLYAGGFFVQFPSAGLFCVASTGGAIAYDSIGCRLQKLP